jgi:hypothetical protein
VCGGKIWIYPTLECPGDGYPGPAVLRVADLTEDQKRWLAMWAEKELVENRKED